MSEIPQPATPPHYVIGVLLYDGIDLLSLSSILTVFQSLPEHFDIQLISERAEPINSQQGIMLNATQDCYAHPSFDVFIIPEGAGIISMLDNSPFMHWLTALHQPSRYLCGLGTGAALLAKAGQLTQRRATTNKKHFHWVAALNEAVKWQPVARWVYDDHRFTASGGMAGIDMCLALLAHLINEETARKTAIQLEHLWIHDPDDDPFAPLHLVE